MMPTDWTPDGSALLGSYWEPLLTGPVALVLWPVSHTTAVKPDRVILGVPGHRFWQGTFSPDGRWISFVVERPNADGRLELGVVAAGGAGPDGWTRIASGRTSRAGRRMAERCTSSRRSPLAFSMCGACTSTLRTRNQWASPTRSHDSIRLRS
jgi:hypothetical protein